MSDGALKKRPKGIALTRALRPAREVPAYAVAAALIAPRTDISDLLACYGGTRRSEGCFGLLPPLSLFFIFCLFLNSSLAQENEHECDSFVKPDMLWLITDEV